MPLRYLKLLWKGWLHIPRRGLIRLKFLVPFLTVENDWKANSAKLGLNQRLYFEKQNMKNFMSIGGSGLHNCKKGGP